jgi:hypothetical protein
MATPRKTAAKPKSKAPARRKPSVPKAKTATATKRSPAAPKAAQHAQVRPVRAKELGALTACPACGSKALAPTQSQGERTLQRVMTVAFLSVPFLGPNGKKCLDCGWRMD